MGKKSLVLNIVKNLRMRIKMILSISLLSVALVWILNSFIIVPEYQATTQIFIEQPPEAAQMADGPAMGAGPAITDTYSVIVRSPEILRKVIIELGMEKETNISELHEQIVVTRPADSQVLNITVAGEDKIKAAAIANSLGEIFIEEIPNLTQTTNAVIISSASEVPESTLFEENTVFSLGVAGAFGLVIGILLAFILEMLNTVFKTGKKENQSSVNKIQTVFK
ncbi:capsular polysaccharide biosynthesis protein [Planomicrobium koreense]|uniref:Capsular polysaccharide biosynthesis protein n=1 Tax=Planococcus koreensis TaxID=112331 RepID=A0A7W8FSM1_9BACL|nr:Wzz/FepE/Etk N-terminal domain-containing protein [Planococcus koreensis]MBB5179171.1 capsular polysaccharide biosynthesis protein [Planococcus koreensis]